MVNASTDESVGQEQHCIFLIEGINAKVESNCVSISEGNGQQLQQQNCF